jgi:hypothetical protein
MNDTAKDLEFIYARFDEFDADSLSAEDSQRFRRLLTIEPLDANRVIDETKTAIAMFQLGLQSYFLSTEQRAMLQDLADDADGRKTREAQRIKQIDRREAFTDFRRRFTIAIAVFSLLCFCIFYFTPSREPYFNALQSLVYEAAMMEERGDGRLDLPSEDLAEIVSFAAASRGLGFEASLPKSVPSEWQPMGATVIDYDPRKIFVAVFSHKARGEKLFFFNFAGSIEELPQSTPFIEGAVDFYPYATDAYNIVCWQITKNTVGMVLGRRSARDLARIVKM